MMSELKWHMRQYLFNIQKKCSSGGIEEQKRHKNQISKWQT